MPSYLLAELLAAIQRRLEMFNGEMTFRQELTDVPSSVIGLPAERVAIKIDPLPHILLLATIEFDQTDIPQMKPVLWWIAMVRRQLTIHQRADLYTVLISDAIGTNTAQKVWHARIESDDRFCRKFVFSPQPDLSARDAADLFLDRTFLAQPWKATVATATRSLDPMDTTATRFAEQALLTVQQARAWLSILASRTEEAKDLGELLLAAMRRPHA